MKTSGLRGKHSVMNNATSEQKAQVIILRAKAKAAGAWHFETRYSTYIGPGCAAERGAICVCVDNKIYALVEKDGTLT